MSVEPSAGQESSAEQESALTIGTNKVVTFHYKLSNEEGKEMENSHSGDPVAYLHGHGGVIRGLATAMEGKTAGESFNVTIQPVDAYGLRNEENQQRIPIKHLHVKKKAKLRVGQIVGVETEKGSKQVTIVKVGKFNVDVDSNHPLAGKVLTFDVDVKSVREASAEEVTHGHAHGVGGHHH